MIALDTNILIYACDKSDAEWQQIALDLIADAVDSADERFAQPRHLRSSGHRV